MKKLHVNLDREAEVAWNSVLSHPNFRRMPQQGVIEVLCATYLRVNAGDCGSKKAVFERVIEPDFSAHDGSDDYIDPADIPGTPEYDAALAKLLEN